MSEKYIITCVMTIKLNNCYFNKQYVCIKSTILQTFSYLKENKNANGCDA